MATVVTNTNIDTLMKVSRGNLDILEELAQDWKKSLSRESDNIQSHALTPQETKE